MPATCTEFATVRGVRFLFACLPLAFGCGKTHDASGPGPNPDGAEPPPMTAGAAGARAVVLAPESERLPTCESASLEISGSESRETWTSNRLLFPTSRQTFRGYAMRGTSDMLSGIWATGAGSEPFEDRELREVANVLIAERGQLQCAAGTRRALRNGEHAALEFDGLGPLSCANDVIPGALRYCHDCEQGGAALIGHLDGDEVLEVTGDRARFGDTLFLQIGWGVLIAQFAPDAAGERLHAGAYLSFGNQLYCFDSATGDAAELGSADVTFSGFRRAETCQSENIHRVARACAKQFTAGRDW